MTLITALLVLTLALVIYLYERTLSSLQSKQFIERQQWQGKLDTLNELLLQRSGFPVDFSKPTRQQFQDRVRNAFHAPGWVADKPATPSKENK